MTTQIQTYNLHQNQYENNQQKEGEEGVIKKIELVQKHDEYGRDAQQITKGKYIDDSQDI